MRAAKRANPKWNRKEIRALQEGLLRWYRRHKRALPWRRDPTPYRVWVAEIMLQQTRVQTVLRYYDRFLDRFPDVAALAAATEEEVLQHWAGLGYYRRARLLHEAAGVIVAESAGRFPQTLDEIRRLPGVGRYTAGAIHSIAFNQPEPVVDGNVMRVIGRLHGIADAPESFFWRAAESWLARDEPADFNQAVMELGALLCVPRNPLCGRCPLLPLCKSGRRQQMPRSRRRQARAAEAVELVVLILECEGKILLMRQPKGGFIPGEWGLPAHALTKKDAPLSGANSLARKILRSSPELRSFPPLRHGITHRSILAHVCRASLAPPLPRLRLAEGFSWQPLPAIERHFTSSLFKKCLAASKSTKNP